jgi:hypothetical protein
MKRNASSTATLAALAVLVVAGWASTGRADWWKHRGRDSIEGSGHVVSQARDVGDFDAIRLEGVADIHIRKGDRIEVEVKAEDNLIDLVETDVRHRELVVRQDDDVTMNTEEGIHVYVTMPRLVELDVRGVGGVDAEDLDEDRLDIDVQGVGSVVLSGKVKRVDLNVEGVGNVDLSDLIAQEARVRHSGVGNVDVYAEKDLDVRASGVGEVRYHGNPEHLERREDGLGRVRSAGR